MLPKSLVDRSLGQVVLKNVQRKVAGKSGAKGYQNQSMETEMNLKSMELHVAIRHKTYYKGIWNLLAGLNLFICLGTPVDRMPKASGHE